LKDLISEYEINRSIGVERHKVGTVANQKINTENPDSVDANTSKTIVFKISIRMLINSVMEVHDKNCIDVAEEVDFWV
jgi:hypothetical protein